MKKTLEERVSLLKEAKADLAALEKHVADSRELADKAGADLGLLLQQLEAAKTEEQAFIAEILAGSLEYSDISEKPDRPLLIEGKINRLENFIDRVNQQIVDDYPRKSAAIQNRIVNLETMVITGAIEKLAGDVVAECGNKLKKILGLVSSGKDSDDIVLFGAHLQAALFGGEVGQKVKQMTRPERDAIYRATLVELSK